MKTEKSDIGKTAGDNSYAVGLRKRDETFVSAFKKRDETYFAEMGISELSDITAIRGECNMKNKITKYDVVKRACKDIIIDDLAKPIVSTISAFVLPGDLQKKVSKKLKLYADEDEERLRDRVRGYSATHDHPRDATGHFAETGDPNGAVMKSLITDNMQVKKRMHAVATLEYVLGILGLLPAIAVGGPYGGALASYAIADGYIRKRTVSSSSLCREPFCGCDFKFEPRLDREPCGTVAVEVLYQIGKAAYKHLKGTYENAERELMVGEN